MRFTKMHGAGNDYIYIDGFAEKIHDPAALAEKMSKPHFGVGADGLILVLPSENADFRMRMFNKDGSEGIMCGNGARCVARFCYEHGLTDKTEFTLETGGGIRPVRLNLEGGRVSSVCVDMGPVQSLKVEPDQIFVSMGNPHAVVLMDANPFLWNGFEREGSRLCKALDANIEFVQVLGFDRLKMRVFERGSGETLACGTGTCASLVAAHTAGRCGRKATVVVRGGEIFIDWHESDGHVLMTGPAETVFEGEWKL
ncbi:MAG: diaminopimelate epimerase [Firmicutes bacterium]|nr:diaminopimelate epimerase [Bacillota bacterium]